MKVLIILSIIISIPIIIIAGAGMFGFIKVANKVLNFLEDLEIKSLIVIIIAMSLTTNSQAQITPVTSFGLGYELQNGAIPVQLTAGISSRSIRGELIAGYTVFFHRNDATIPKILFLRYGLNVSKGSLEIMPLIGAGMALPTTYEVPIEDNGDPDHVYDYKQVRNPSEFKILYGLKVQKNIGMGGLFVSAEHCKLSYLTAGMYVRIN